MAYLFYLDGQLLPVTPGSLTVKVSGQNQTATLIDYTEINRLFPPGLTDVSFTMLLPSASYPFSNGETADIGGYLGHLERLKVSQKPFQFLVVRALPDGTPLHNTNLTVSLEDYEITEDAEELGFDTQVEVKLKQWRDYGTKRLEVDASGTATAAAQERPAQNPPQRSSYTVVSGDCLWNIAKRYLGDGSRYTEIWELNRDKVVNPNLIYPGQVLTLPG